MASLKFRLYKAQQARTMQMALALLVASMAQRLKLAPALPGAPTQAPVLRHPLQQASDAKYALAQLERRQEQATVLARQLEERVAEARMARVEAAGAREELARAHREAQVGRRAKKAGLKAGTVTGCAAGADAALCNAPARGGCYNSHAELRTCPTLVISAVSYRGQTLPATPPGRRPPSSCPPPWTPSPWTARGPMRVGTRRGARATAGGRRAPRTVAAAAAAWRLPLTC